MRIADVLKIDNSGLSDELYRYTLRAHFDFVVATADSLALFAVEFDGPQHSEAAQRRKDAQKDAICKALGLPLLRITSDFLTRRIRKFTVLSWLVNLWFLSESFYEAQNAGSVPPDEPFLYFSILAESIEDLRTKGETFPYDPSLPSRLFVAETCKNGLCRDFCPTVFGADDPEGQVISLAVIRVTEHEAIVGQASCQTFRFPPVSPDELSGELASIDAADKLRRYLAGEPP